MTLHLDKYRLPAASSPAPFCCGSTFLYETIYYFFYPSFMFSFMSQEHHIVMRKGDCAFCKVMPGFYVAIFEGAASPSAARLTCSYTR
jgi:hypothetical protein